MPFHQTGLALCTCLLYLTVVLSFDEEQFVTVSHVPLLVQTISNHQMHASKKPDHRALLHSNLAGSPSHDSAAMTVCIQLLNEVLMQSKEARYLVYFDLVLHNDVIPGEIKALGHMTVIHRINLWQMRLVHRDFL